ncbi:MAG: phosphate ABC transporter permease PstA [Thermoanaerobaculia bacterium]|nr:phosphate ABC transporter permease PstA [Thermoanaerobaculia bacterium]
MVWLTGGALAICTFMVFGLLFLVLMRGLSTFWPLPVEQVTTSDGRVFMGEVTRDDDYQPTDNVIAALTGEMRQAADVELASGDGWAHRRLFRTGNYRITQNHFSWVNDWEVDQLEQPEWAMVLERLEWGRFYGFPEAFVKMTLVDRNGMTEEAFRNELRRQANLPAPEGAAMRLVARGTGSVPFELVDPSDAATASSLVGFAEVHEGAEAAWHGFREYHAEVRERREDRRQLEKHDTGRINHRQEQARLKVREIELEIAEAEAKGQDSKVTKLEAERAHAQKEFEEVRVWADREFARIRSEIDAINEENSRYQMLFRTAGEGHREPALTFQRLDDIVRAYPANRLALGEKLALFGSRWKEFLTEEPREANSEGGVFPAIFGTVAMTLIMSIAVVPFGVLAALYLREYAKGGPLTSAVRIAVNNLAGVPSIVFGVFGLGFFCYVVGANIDELLFAAELPNPTFGKGGLLWASLTLALLTLPVVIVATEEAVSAVPNSMREGSYACGASKWQTIKRIVLPRALPGIITGMILAIARGAGEVAPLMLVGAVKLAPELPIDGLFPYIHPERSFMHLGFHIYDVGFQSQNSEAAKPMVYTTTLLLIGIIATLNLATIWLRNRLRRKFAGGQF